MKSKLIEENERLYLLIYADIIVTKGIKKIVLIDSSRNKVFELPISYFDLIKDFENSSLGDIEIAYDYENVALFIDFIIKNDLGFITNNKEAFPTISEKYISPEKINNSIIEIDKIEQLEKLGNWLQDLDKLGCKFYELRFYSAINFKVIQNIFSHYTFNSLNSVNLYLQSSPHYDLADCLMLLEAFPYIKNIFIFQSSENKIINTNENSILSGEQKIVLLTESLSRKNCGKINYDMFLPKEINQITENLCYNSCLHKKLSIDVDGNIKNCPSMSKTFGNANNVAIDGIVKSTDFKKYWYLTKDNINICKDCEYRYICMDCRAYTEQTDQNNKGLDISKPLKCGYNPYIGEWEDWSKNPLKQKAIAFYGMEELIKNEA